MMNAVHLMFTSLLTLLSCWPDIFLFDGVASHLTILVSYDAATRFGTRQPTIE